MKINLLVILGLFIVASIIGWFIEVFFRRFFSAKHWINPGFLTGPCLPIYGFGAASMYIIITLFARIEDKFSNYPLYAVTVIIVIGVVMTLIEYIGGLIFIKGMHIRLWDYSKNFLNIQGIICPLFSFIWTVVGALFFFFVYEPLGNFIAYLIANKYSIFILGIFYGVLIVDFGISVHFVERIRNFAKSNKTVIHFELLKVEVQKYLQEQKEKTNFILPFAKFNEVRDKIAERIKDKINK